MTKYEQLTNFAYKNKLDIIETNFNSHSEGLCIGDVIALNQNLNIAKKTCVLAEELGHYFTTVGDIIDQTDVNNRKQEIKARKWGYCKLVNIEGLVEACKQGCRNINEIAEYLEVTEEFLQDALQYFKNKYGAYYTLGKYTIYFNDFGYYVDMEA